MTTTLTLPAVLAELARQVALALLRLCVNRREYEEMLSEEEADERMWANAGD